MNEWMMEQFDCAGDKRHPNCPKGNHIACCQCMITQQGPLPNGVYGHIEPPQEMTTRNRAIVKRKDKEFVKGKKELEDLKDETSSKDEEEEAKPVVKGRKRKAQDIPDAAVKKLRATNGNAKTLSAPKQLNSVRTRISLPTGAGSHPDPGFMNLPTFADMAIKKAQQAVAEDDREEDGEEDDSFNKLPSPAEYDGETEEELE